MRKFENVNAIGIKATFKGNGCVNFDAGEQKFELMGMGLLKGKVNDNKSYAKKVYYKDANGNTTFLYKVSSECVRHAIFSENMPYQSPTITAVPQVLYNALAMPSMLTRGYMIANKNFALKRKSPLTITDAVEDGEKRSVISFDFHTRCGEKNVAKCEDESKDTTIYSVENVGNVTYKADGNIDLQELQFISADVLYDRMAVNVDGGKFEKIYLDALKHNLPNFDPKFGYYFIKNTIYQDEWAERGIMLNEESVDYLAKYILKNILNVKVVKRNAIFEIESLKITVNGEEIEVTKDNINDFYFGVAEKYQQASEDKILANKKLAESLKGK